MADDIAYITFDNDEIGTNIVGSTPQSNAFVNGTLELDYTTNQVSGTYSVSGDVSGTHQIQIGGAITKNGNTTSFTDGQLSLSFSGERPSQADLITYKTDPSNPSSPTYSSTDEPTPQLSSSDTAPCFSSRTAIMTVRGAVAVEHLAVGDDILTASGATRTIRWIGHRKVDCRACRRELMPIRIAAGAFGRGVPARDLYLSPGHAICVDVLGTVLIPASLLANGASIAQVEVDEVTYWHVELDSHDVILAENLPCESYLDMANRAFFVESGVVAVAALPDADRSVRTHADFCLPFVDGGALLDAVRERLAVRLDEADRDDITARRARGG